MRYLAPFRYFRAVAKAGSVRGAAENLAITPSALNRRIQDFEAEVGMQLFERSHEGLSLNAAGELVMAFVQSQQFELSKLNAQLHDLQGLKRGEIRMACTQALTTSALPQIISDFRAEHPFVRFDVRTLRGRQEEGWLQDKQIEFAICIGRKRSLDFETLFSAPLRIGVVVSKHHRLFVRERIKLGELVGEDLSLPKEDFRLYEVLKAAFLTRRLPFEPIVTTDDFGLGQALSGLDGALSFRLVHRLSDPVDGQTKVIPLVEDDIDPVEIQILKLKSLRISPLADAFVQTVQAHLGHLESTQRP